MISIIKDIKNPLLIEDKQNHLLP